jgi:UDP-glucuronate 4-epimerase
MRRDFTHVDDIVRGVLAALDAKGSPGFRAYNLGSGAPIDLRSLVDAIASTAGITPHVETGPVPLGDVDATFADIARAREELGWVPRLTLSEGLPTVLAWVRQHP